MGFSILFPKSAATARMNRWETNKINGEDVSTYCSPYRHRHEVHISKHGRQCFPALFLVLIVLILFGIGLYLYSQAVACRMKRALCIPCNMEDDDAEFD